MTQLERIKRLEASIAFWDRLIPIEMLKAEKQTHFSVELREDMRIALAALRGPQPDPDTGWLPCGCGGSAAYHISYDDENWSTTVRVACNKCLIHVAFSALYELRGEEALADDAKRAWNTAMGWREKE